MYPRQHALPGFANGGDIPFEIVNRVIVICVGAPQKSLCLTPGAQPQPQHLLHLRRRERSGTICFDGDSVE